MAFDLAALSTVQWFALVVLVFALIKLVVVSVNARAWLKFAKGLWKSPMLVGVVSIILAAVVLYYLMQAGFSIVDVFSVMLFIVLISAATMAVYAHEFMDMAGKMLKTRGFMKKAWLPILIWLVLIVWALKELFF